MSAALTPSRLRYLLVIAQIARETGGAVRCIDIAVRLGVARASVCRMVSAFVREGLLAQAGGRGGVRLTARGEEAAAQCVRRCERLRGAMASRFALSDYDARECAMALLTGLPDATLAALEAGAAET